MSRTVNSHTVPTFLSAALGNIRKAQQLCHYVPKNVTVKKAALLDALPLSSIVSRKLVAHGAGVYEDPENRSIWYKEGKILKRRQQDIDKLISNYVSSVS